MILILVPLIIQAQEYPHGDKFTISCENCHTTEGWKYSSKAIFNHSTTKFILEGQHLSVNCRQCHVSLVFSEAKSNCSDCHSDLHNTTVGNDCSRCHTPKSWIVTNITEIHQKSRFPLMGAHNTADCTSCHLSSSKLEFQPLGINCYDCHKNDYESTTKPNHKQSGLSTDCVQCHRIDAFEWSSAGINHDFFPLTLGHNINDCAACHKTDVFQPLSKECYSCHQSDYQSSTNPKHKQPDFSIVCTQCHTTDPDWKPAKFEIHDAGYFPIYTGSHNGEWASCTDCHKQPDNYSIFSCIDCHEHNKSKMDGEHREVNGYSYNSIACYGCHPTGRKEGAFNHNITGFELKGAHIQTECVSCHKNGFSGTSSECNSCHTSDFQQAANPNHSNAGISVDCKICHTETVWKPSVFNHTATTGFALTGGHNGRQCADCHKGNTTSATSECVSCHQANYNQAPFHLPQKFSTECKQCHNTNGWDESIFEHSKTAFTLTGAHIATECTACHTQGYKGTSVHCNACHNNDYNKTVNPNHSSIGIPVNCNECHTTNPGWEPAAFPIHQNFFVFRGAHLTVANNCYLCHAGNYSNTPKTCFDCHSTDYNNTKDPVHLTAQFPTNCESCHSESAWEPATFNHDGQYFPIYSGKHNGKWNKCSDCHTQPAKYSVFSCINCHEHNKTDMDKDHQGVGGYVYNNSNCLSCHPKG